MPALIDVVLCGNWSLEADTNWRQQALTTDSAILHRQMAGTRVHICLQNSIVVCLMQMTDCAAAAGAHEAAERVPLSRVVITPYPQKAEQYFTKVALAARTAAGHRMLCETVRPTHRTALLQKICASACPPYYKFTMPSEFALREMPHLINQEFYMVSSPKTKERWRVLLTPRRNKGKFEHTICSKGWKKVSPARKPLPSFKPCSTFHVIDACRKNTSAQPHSVPCMHCSLSLQELHRVGLALLWSASATRNCHCCKFPGKRQTSYCLVRHCDKSASSLCAARWGLAAGCRWLPHTLCAAHARSWSAVTLQPQVPSPSKLNMLCMEP